MNVELPETLVIIESVVYKSNGFAIAPIIETFLTRLFGFEPWALERFRDRAYNLTIAKLTPDSSMNIKSLKQTSLIFCQNSYRRFRTLSVPLSEGKRVFFKSHV